MRRQYDGYLRGHGLELATFLLDMKIVNGLGLERKRVANGAGCLAAQMIAQFKTVPGDFYIESIPADPEDLDQIDYVYNVHVDAGEITVTVVGDRQEFQGTAAELFDYCAAAGRAE
jgi:hypothetical protein